MRKKKPKAANETVQQAKAPSTNRPVSSTGQSNIDKEGEWQGKCDGGRKARERKKMEKKKRSSRNPNKK